MINQPRTEAQMEASRRNGAQSNGPVTEEGKAISSRNSYKDGLTGNTIILDGESREKFDALFASQIAQFQPLGDDEMILVQNMVVAHWNKMRVWGFTAAGWNMEMRRQLEHNPELLNFDMPTRAHLAFAESDKTGPALDRYFRLETKFDREYHRQRRALLDMQAKRAKSEI
jgi:hypothetical protein